MYVPSVLAEDKSMLDLHTCILLDISGAKCIIQVMEHDFRFGLQYVNIKTGARQTIYARGRFCTKERKVSKEVDLVVRDLVLQLNTDGLKPNRLALYGMMLQKYQVAVLLAGDLIKDRRIKRMEWGYRDD